MLQYTVPTGRCQWFCNYLIEVIVGVRSRYSDHLIPVYHLLDILIVPVIFDHLTTDSESQAVALKLVRCYSGTWKEPTLPSKLLDDQELIGCNYPCCYKPEVFEKGKSVHPVERLKGAEHFPVCQRGTWSGRLFQFKS